jgi:hypothetical protein
LAAIYVSPSIFQPVSFFQAAAMPWNAHNKADTGPRRAADRNLNIVYKTTYDVISTHQKLQSICHAGSAMREMGLGFATMAGRTIQNP